ncbi:uncharacterized protein N7473_003437 [Penicillium subrubescens]|uniref:L-pipecolate oxidase n=1 Tax=Penicillium subrubescens TaxID=1316194 RepID=A0A1Q5TI68_9EURO|nr:uncharacterized protein N7473_003437 [Penicillium subrubescens]KAJ5906521.1 hypothetical protein N7473_003437 [Penicillium subrubescens]OKO99913.1 L-pipecolate oxidase [Penicillium subrubescens]
MDKDTRIIFIGGGCFGISTAYHLAQRGYTSIRVLDRYPPPSCEATSTDISKIIRSDYNEPFAANLSKPFVGGSIETCKKLGVRGIERLTPEMIRSRFPVVTGNLEGWNSSVWNPTAGWAAAGQALERMANAAMEKGVQYISVETKGHVRQIIFDESTGQCKGAFTADGTKHEAYLGILAAGAWTPSLLDMHGQLTAKGHAVAYIQLTPAETKYYSSFPIKDNLELGYFFPPQEDGIFKMAHSQFITNMQTNKNSNITTSIPHTFVQAPNDGLPLEIEAQMRRNLRRVLPELADRPFCYTPHGFTFLPVIGKYVAALLEGTLAPHIFSKWQWRAGQKVEVKNLAHMDPE